MGRIGIRIILISVPWIFSWLQLLSLLVFWCIHPSEVSTNFALNVTKKQITYVENIFSPATHTWQSNSLGLPVSYDDKPPTGNP